MIFVNIHRLRVCPFPSFTRLSSVLLLVRPGTSRTILQSKIEFTSPFSYFTQFVLYWTRPQFFFFFFPLSLSRLLKHSPLTFDPVNPPKTLLIPLSTHRSLHLFSPVYFLYKTFILTNVNPLPNLHPSLFFPLNSYRGSKDRVHTNVRRVICRLSNIFQQFRNRKSSQSILTRFRSERLRHHPKSTGTETGQVPHTCVIVMGSSLRSRESLPREGNREGGPVPGFLGGIEVVR